MKTLTNGKKGRIAAIVVISLIFISAVSADAHGERRRKRHHPKPPTTTTTIVTTTTRPVTSSTTIPVFVTTTSRPSVTTSIPATTSTSTSTTTSTTSTSTVVPTTTVPSLVVTPEQFGAVGNGTTDDCVALQSALNAMSGKTLVLNPSRTYRHSCILVASRSGRIEGGGTRSGNSIIGASTLASTNPNASAVQVTADNLVVVGVKFTSNATSRLLSNDDHKIVLFGTNLTLESIEVNGSAAAGILADGAFNYSINNVVVKNTLADSIHNTGGSGPATILNPYIENSGDDGVAVVSYGGQSPTHDITISNPVIRGTKARGVSVVGGTNITYLNVDIDNTRAAGIYVAREPSYSTLGVNTVRVTGGVVRRANYGAGVDHGSIFIYADGGTVRDVIISDIDIFDQSGTSPWVLGALTGSNVQNCQYVDIRAHTAPRSTLVFNATSGLTLTNVRYI